MQVVSDEGPRRFSPGAAGGVSVARLGTEGVAALAAALARASGGGLGMRRRWWAHRAVSVGGGRARSRGGGNGRIWLGGGRAAIAHRFASAAVHGVDALVRRAGAGSSL